jgi:lipopolysaccharide biosynthesis glycosyltransferase
MNLRPIVTACDERFAMPLATALRSIVDANRSDWPLEFYVLCDGFSQSTKNEVVNSLPPRTAVIRWIPVDLALYNEFETPHWVSSKMVFARFLLPKIFPDPVSKVLYLDPDVLVLDDLRVLWETDLEGSVLGAVEDGINGPLQKEELRSTFFKGVPRVQCYFNAGVLLVDLTRWREARITHKAFEYLKEHPRSPFADQDALNFACDGLWKKLDPRWNFHDRHWETNFSEIEPSQRPGIVHFVTDLKPWKASSVSINRTFYDGFRRRTRFPRTIQEKLPLEYWFRCKRALKRSRLLSLLWTKLKRSSNGLRK